MLQARVQESELENTWLGQKGYCTKEQHAGGTSATWDCPPLKCYAGGIYFAAATITSIGYGDISATLSNTGETFIAATIMLSSCVAWAHFIGVF